jgi:hypothetical protein
MKTLHLTNMFHPSSGGVHTFYRALLNAATPANQVRLVVPWESDGVEDINDHAKIYHVRAPRHLFVDPRYRVILPHRFLIPYRGTIQKILEREQPDLVEVCDKYSLVFLASALRKGWLRSVRHPAVVGLSSERMDDNVSQFLHPGKLGERFSRHGFFAISISSSTVLARRLPMPRASKASK